MRFYIDTGKLEKLTTMIYRLEVYSTGEMPKFPDFDSAKKAFDECDDECELYTRNGDFVAQKLWVETDDDIILEAIWDYDEADTNLSISIDDKEEVYA